jgi:hypothetical protein
MGCKGFQCFSVGMLMLLLSQMGDLAVSEAPSVIAIEDWYCSLIPSEENDVLVYGEIIEVGDDHTRTLRVIELFYNQTEEIIDVGSTINFGCGYDGDCTGTVYDQGWQGLLLVDLGDHSLVSSAKVVDEKVMCAGASSEFPGKEIDEIIDVLISSDGQPMSSDECLEIVRTWNIPYLHAGCESQGCSGCSESVICY